MAFREVCIGDVEKRRKKGLSSTHAETHAFCHSYMYFVVQTLIAVVSVAKQRCLGGGGCNQCCYVKTQTACTSTGIGYARLSHPVHVHNVGALYAMKAFPVQFIQALGPGSAVELRTKEHGAQEHPA